MSKARSPEEILAALDERLREARGVLGDLERFIKEARKVIPNAIKETIEKEVAAQLKVLGEQTAEAMRKAVEKVSKEFDRLEQAYLGTEPKSIKSGKPSLEELTSFAARMRGN